MLRNNIHGSFIVAIIPATRILLSGPAKADNYTIHHNPKGHILDKFLSYDLVDEVIVYCLRRGEI
jgi:hypothetical protein